MATTAQNPTPGPSNNSPFSGLGSSGGGANTPGPGEKLTFRGRLNELKNQIKNSNSKKKLMINAVIIAVVVGVATFIIIWMIKPAFFQTRDTDGDATGTLNYFTSGMFSLVIGGCGAGIYALNSYLNPETPKPATTV